MSTGIVVWLNASPDAGGIEPDVLVSEGTTVKLFGGADRHSFDERCRPQSQQLPIRWEMRLQPPGPLATEVVTTSLRDRTTNHPSFAATRVGLYVVKVSSSSHQRTVRIRVVPKGLSWVPIGPAGVRALSGDRPDVGRINVLLRTPQPGSVLYAGSSQGGLYRFVDNDFGWHNISEGANLAAAEILAIEFGLDKALYVAVGEQGGDRSGYNETGTGLWRLAGSKWTETGLGLNCPSGAIALPGRVHRLLARRLPAIASVLRWELIGATTSGLYRSTDAGNCWTTLVSGVGQVWDVAGIPSTPLVLLASTERQGLIRVERYRSAPAMANAFSAFPGSNVYGRFASGKARHYAVTAMVGGAQARVAVTTDGGVTWTVSNAPCSRQCDWFPAIAVDPRNDQVLYFGEVDPWISTDGGQTYSELGDITQVHPDKHWFLVDSAGHYLTAATDGGVFRLPLGVPGVTGVDWTPINRDLQTNQSATLSVVNSDNSAVAMGTWDNGTKRRETGVRWIGFQGGDGEGSGIGQGANGLVYFGHGNAGIDSTVIRQPGAVAAGIGVGFRTNPYNPAQLWLLGAAASGELRNRLVVTTDAATVTTPALRCADPRSPAAAAPSAPFAIAFSNDGYAVVSHWDGSIFRFRMNDASQGTAACTGPSARTAATDVETISAAQGTAAGPGVGFDAADSSRVFVVVPDHPTPAARVRLYTRGTDGRWTATDLAGALPAAARDTLTSAISSESLPAFPGTIHVGTRRGVWQGSTDVAGNTAWTRAIHTPDSWISDLQGAGTTLRLASYGRGIWERRNFRRPCDNGACATRVTPLSRCLACWLPFAEADSSSPSSSWSATIEALLADTSRLLQSRTISVTAMNGDRPLAAVASRVAARDIDESTLVLQLSLIGLDTIATRVTSLRLTGATPAGEITEVVPVNVVMRDPRVAVVSLSTVWDGTSQVRRSPHVWDTVRTTAAPVDLKDGVFAVPAGTTLALRTPPMTDGFTLRRVVVAAAGREMQTSTGGLVTITVTGDTKVGGFYRQ